jgi:hypothetical protein
MRVSMESKQAGFPQQQVVFAVVAAPPTQTLHQPLYCTQVLLVVTTAVKPCCRCHCCCCCCSDHYSSPGLLASMPTTYKLIGML